MARIVNNIYPKKSTYKDTNAYDSDEHSLSLYVDFLIYPNWFSKNICSSIVVLRLSCLCYENSNKLHPPGRHQTSKLFLFPFSTFLLLDAVWKLVESCFCSRKLLPVWRPAILAHCTTPPAPHFLTSPVRHQLYPVRFRSPHPVRRVCCWICILCCENKGSRRNLMCCSPDDRKTLINQVSTVN